jgi:hypothetical protein
MNFWTSQRSSERSSQHSRKSYVKSTVIHWYIYVHNMHMSRRWLWPVLSPNHGGHELDRCTSPKFFPPPPLFPPKFGLGLHENFRNFCALVKREDFHESSWELTGYITTHAYVALIKIWTSPKFLRVDESLRSNASKSWSFHQLNCARGWILQKVTVDFIFGFEIVYKADNPNSLNRQILGGLARLYVDNTCSVGFLYECRYLERQTTNIISYF